MGNFDHQMLANFHFDGEHGGIVWENCGGDSWWFCGETEVWNHGWSFFPFQQFQTNPGKGPDHQVNLRKVYEQGPFVLSELTSLHCAWRILKVSMISTKYHKISISLCWKLFKQNAVGRSEAATGDPGARNLPAEVPSFVSRTHRSEWWRTICAWRCGLSREAGDVSALLRVPYSFTCFTCL